MGSCGSEILQNAVEQMNWLILIIAETIHIKEKKDKSLGNNEVV